jgi:hypothetical protein
VPFVFHVSRVTLIADGLEGVIVLELLIVAGVVDDGLEVVLQNANSDILLLG